MLHVGLEKACADTSCSPAWDSSLWQSVSVQALTVTIHMQLLACTSTELLAQAPHLQSHWLTCIDFVQNITRGGHTTVPMHAF